MNRKTIAFIGGGNMGEAIISKMVSSDWKGDDIHVIDHNEEKLERLSSEYGVHAPRLYERLLPLWMRSSSQSIGSVKA